MENLKVLREKKVSINKNQECWRCRRTNEKGVKMIFNTIVFDKLILNTYRCISCLKMS